MKINPNQHQKAICCHPSCGPIFGGGHDIGISSNSNSLSNLGNAFKHPEYNAGTNEAKSFFTGSDNFQLSEIEVYKRV